MKYLDQSESIEYDQPVDYLCGDCGSDNVVAIATLGQVEVDHICALCGSKNILGVDHSAKYQRTQPPSVGQMLHRQRKAERNLPPTAMEQALLAKNNARAREDLVELLTELA